MRAVSPTVFLVFAVVALAVGGCEVDDKGIRGTGGANGSGGRGAGGSTAASGGAAGGMQSGSGGLASGGAGATASGGSGGAVSGGSGGAAGGAAGKPCATQSQCRDDELCTTVDGVCNRPPECGSSSGPGAGGCTTVCYGTCRPADVKLGCGNTLCEAGTECCNASCGTCVAPGAGCTKQICRPTGCERDSDCQPVADYCTGCDCRSLAKGSSLPECPGPGVRCLVDPCTDRVARCVGGACVLAVKN